MGLLLGVVLCLASRTLSPFVPEDRSAEVELLDMLAEDLLTMREMCVGVSHDLEDGDLSLEGDPLCNKSAVILQLDGGDILDIANRFLYLVKILVLVLWKMSLIERLMKATLVVVSMRLACLMELIMIFVLVPW